MTESCLAVFTRPRKIHVWAKTELFQVHLQSKLTNLKSLVELWAVVCEETPSYCNSNVRIMVTTKNTFLSSAEATWDFSSRLNETHRHYSLFSRDGFQFSTNIDTEEWGQRFQTALHVTSNQCDWTFEEDQNTLKCLSVSVSETQTLIDETLERAISWDGKKFGIAMLAFPKSGHNLWPVIRIPSTSLSTQWRAGIQVA